MTPSESTALASRYPGLLTTPKEALLILFQDATDRGVRKPSDKPMEWTQYTAPDGLGRGQDNRGCRGEGQRRTVLYRWSCVQELREPCASWVRLVCAVPMQEREPVL